MNSTLRESLLATPTKGPVTRTPLSPAAEIVSHCRANGIPVFDPGELEYERSVASTNLLYRYTRPDCVVQPESAEEVAAVVRLCRENKIGLIIKTGGHSYAGHSMAHTGVHLDMHRLKGTTLDMNNRVIYVEGGALWLDVYKRLINGRHNGWAVNGGRCPTVGVSGFLMGAGLGPFSRTMGMGCDSVISITLVTADGDIITVRETDDPKSPEGQLFWAVRGGGGGNFGIVVQWKLRVEQLKDMGEDGNCGNVTAGRYLWYHRPNDWNTLGKQDQEALSEDFKETMRQFYRYPWPNRITIDSTWVRRSNDARGTMIRFISYCDGNSDYFGKHIDEALKQKDVKEQLKRRCMPEKSTRFFHETLTAQWNEETRRTIQNSTQFRLYAGFSLSNAEATDAVVNILHKELDHFAELFNADQAECSVSLIHAGGATSDLPRASTAYRWRAAVYQAYIMITFEDKWLEREMRAFLARFKAQLRVHSISRHAAFINFPDDDIPKDAYERAYYGWNAERLREVKAEWDPTDFFKWSQSIQLPAAELRMRPQMAPADGTLGSRSTTTKTTTFPTSGPWLKARTAPTVPLPSAGTKGSRSRGPSG
ncbi:berberine family protein [Apiospora kogelbergensis]|uniref:berberine family protein n=1 Tax=Apiospora kogelbergensis TaxID=1337665 RepID=UPI00312D369F